jgi:dihydrofolate reductase
MPNVAVFAMDMAGGMGFQNALPWPHCPEDLKSFKSITKGQVLLMGSTTFESMEAIGMEWGDRTPAVLTRDPSKYDNGMGVKDVLELLRGPISVYVIGGASLFSCKEIWDHIDIVYETLFTGVYLSDAYMPAEALDYMEQNFERTDATKLTDGENGPQCIRILRTRKPGRT